MFEVPVCLYGQQKVDIKHFVAYTCTCIYRWHFSYTCIFI